MDIKKNIFFAVLIGFMLYLDAPVFAQQKDSAGKDTIIVGYVDQIPQFPGGIRGWQRFLQHNLDVTEAIQAMDSTAYVNYGMKQTAYLEFTVCEDGKICDIEIVNKDKISPEFAEEALRVMEKSPKWKPAKLHDKVVRTRFKQAITAILD